MAISASDFVHLYKIRKQVHQRGRYGSSEGRIRLDLVNAETEEGIRKEAQMFRGGDQANRGLHLLSERAP